MSLGIASEGSLKDDKVVTKRHENKDGIEKLVEESVGPDKCNRCIVCACVCVSRMSIEAGISGALKPTAHPLDGS